ncbi:hypothetical protein LC605_15785 [Nostoc sp. CHAB 5836]|uniref:hypothetical protein n=1 Tax=Nostoc sp. CHAB 5836 TaxID=2780404 RepID=UPI001E3DE9DA|nr:hypothetical protein [Nostoc sp. CHAB 5836]MCC5616506.1 hypothetical protein [Nostoc sp. CHAB 5836]
MHKQNNHSESEKSSPNSESLESKYSLSCEHRRSGDPYRATSVYKYLLNYLTDLGINEKEDIVKPNESSIANQWGQKNNRIFIRRVLRSVLPEYYSEKERISVVPGLTLGKLVEILEGIQEYRAAKRLETPKSKILRILTRGEKLRVFRIFYQLTLEEKEVLKLPIHPGEAILQEFLSTVTDPSKGLKTEDTILFYKKITDIFYNSFNKLESKNRLNITLSTTDIIQNNIEIILAEFYQGIDAELKSQKIKELVSKVCDQISRIELQSGLRQYKSMFKNEIFTDDVQHKTSLIPHNFIEHLTRCIVENKALSDDFPIHLKHFEIEKIHPLPLYLKTKEQKFGLLNPLLLEDEEDEEDVVGFKNQFAYKIKVHFYIKIPDNYQPWIPEKAHQIRSFNQNENKLEFFEEISGIGSPIHNIVAAINRVLFWDIPSLSSYLPLARDILNNNEFFGSSSLVWSYSLINLCNKSDIEKAIQQNKTYDEIISNNEVIYGEYCGFDTVEIAAKAALQARLRAIQQTGINPVTYMTELCHRVEEIDALRLAEGYVNFYPFSLKAMEGYLNKTLFCNRYRVVDNNLNFIEVDDGKAWSTVAYDAHLNITDFYLKEGLYRIAKKYLDVLKPHIIEAEKGNNKCFSDFIFVKYELCLFRYNYLADLEDIESRQAHSDRGIAIRAATDSLNNAEEYLKNILRKYYIVDACGQSNFHPFFYLLSRVYAHRAKLYIFTSSYTDHPSNRWDALIQPIHLLEKARIYAARDANPALYAYWSAYQSWCYLMVAYLGDYKPSYTGFSREECIDWSKRLIEHALICYERIGKICYQQIKDNGGRITEVKKDGKYYDHYGDMQIQVVPLIQELSEGSDESEQIYEPENNVINFDFSIFKKICTKEHKSVYLFGTHSSILLFGMGMLELCDDEKKESEKVIKIQKAIRMFTYCSAIAEDGNKEKKDNDGKFYLERIFSPGDSLVRGLYPHRLTQFADLGKIWAATCKSILLLYNSTFDWQDIDKLLENLPTSYSKSVLEDNCGQKRYNGHLESHCDRLIQYFEQLKCKKLNLTNLTEIRNKIVKDIFKIMRGESDVKP